MINNKISRELYIYLSHLRQNSRNVIGLKEPNTVLYSVPVIPHRRYIILIYRRRPYIIFVFGFPSFPIDGILVRYPDASVFI